MNEDLLTAMWMRQRPRLCAACPDRRAKVLVNGILVCPFCDASNMTSCAGLGGCICILPDGWALCDCGYTEGEQLIKHLVTEHE